MDFGRYKYIAAGILCFFDNGKTVLLGKEYRKRCGAYYYMEFGGRREYEETLAETACREANEETAYTLNISLEQVEKAEKLGHYIDYYNEVTRVFYRMYCLKFDNKPDIESYKESALKINSLATEKVEWKYFDSFDVVFNRQGINLCTEIQLYPTMLARLELFKISSFFFDFMG